MPYRWLIHQDLKRKRQRIREQVFRRVDTVVKDSRALKRRLSDFPAVAEYLAEKFPDVDLSVVDIYVAPPKVMNKAGWEDIGGCYVSDKKVILVKSDINESRKAKGKFQKLMRKICPMDTSMEDVLVHECIHAVSDLIGRSLAKYQHMEEEFVYSNCIEFYYQKGMSDEDIVNNNFLPFCLNDVYHSSQDMSEIFAAVGKSISDVRGMTEEEYQKFLNTHADEIVPMIKDKAQEKAHQMIELYHKYGAQVYKTESNNVVEDAVSLRFSSLDLD